VRSHIRWNSVSEKLVFLLLLDLTRDRDNSHLYRLNVSLLKKPLFLAGMNPVLNALYRKLSNQSTVYHERLGLFLLSLTLFSEQKYIFYPLNTTFFLGGAGDF